MNVVTVQDRILRHCIVAQNIMEKVDSMTKQNKICKIWRLMLALAVGVFVSVFSLGAVTAHATETTVENAVEDQTPQEAGSEDNGGGAMILLMGGMLIIILAVVLSVVGTFVSSAAIADEL